MNVHVAAPFHCPACNALLPLTIEPGPAPQPVPPASLPPLPQSPPHTPPPGTSEAFALLGRCAVNVDLYGARELRVNSRYAMHGLTYSAVVSGTVALVDLLTPRFAGKVVRSGVSTATAAPRPLPLSL